MSTHQVFQAKVIGEQEPIVFCVSKQRYLVLQQEIKSGRRLIEPDSLLLLYDNMNRNDALNLTNWQEF